jgi:hypothetical protein
MGTCPVTSPQPKCNSFTYTDPGSYAGFGTNSYVGITDSSGHTLVSASLGNGQTGSWTYTPSGVNITVSVVTRYNDPSFPGDDPANAATWPAVNAAGYPQTLQCYHAVCSFNSITGTLPGGYIAANGAFTVTATVFNDGAADIPGNLPIGGNAFELQSNGGSYGFGPVGIGGLARGVGRAVSFTVANAGSGGTLSGQPAFNGAFFFGSGCSAPISVYHPPTMCIYLDGTGCNVGGGVGTSCSSQTMTGTIQQNDPNNTTPLSAAIYVDGIYRTTEYGSSFTYDFSGLNLQDGANHTFMAIPQDAIQNGPSVFAVMTGCGNFSLAAIANGGNLSPTEENPSTFSGSIVVTPTYNPAPAPVSWVGPRPGIPVSGTYSFTITRAGVTTVVAGYPASYPSPVPSSGAPNSWTIPTAAGFQAGDKYCLQLDALQPQAGLIDNTGNILYVSNPGPISTTTAGDPPTCKTIHNDPYFKAFGGNGVASGGDFASTGSCTGGGVLASWYNNFGGADYGASSQFGTFALSAIRAFGSAQGNTSTPPPFHGPPTGLSFANTTSVGPPGGDRESPSLGGSFGTTGNCLSEPGKPSGSVPIGSSYTVSSGGTGATAYSYSGGLLTINSTGAISEGNNIAIYVTGDVYITNNITYQPSTVGFPWIVQATSLLPAPTGTPYTTNIPSFVLVATGNIYIDPTVTELDGTYVAKRSTAAPTKGKIYTCSNSTTPVQPTSSFYTSCNNQLNVYGGLVADQVNLMRTYGSLRDSEGPNSNESTIGSAPRACDNRGPQTSATTPTCAAETLNFDPELYLSSQPIQPPTNGTTQYDAITSLPPVL